MRLGDLLGRVEQRAAELLVRRRQFAGAPQPLEDRVGLDGELVDRQMLAGHRHRLGQLGAPGRLALAGAGVDEVERSAREDRRRGLDRLDRFGDVVTAAERLEVGVVERLDADRQAVDAGGAIAAEAPRLDAGGIGLEGDFGVGGERPGGGHRVDQACTVCGFISEGVPPPKKIERASRPGVSAARWAISVLKAATNRSSSTGSARTCELKSQ